MRRNSNNFERAALLVMKGAGHLFFFIVMAGFAPHLRYNFATGTRWIPYLEIGAGLSATSIGPTDLSHFFEFNDILFRFIGERMSKFNQAPTIEIGEGVPRAFIRKLIAGDSIEGSSQCHTA